MPLCDPWTSGDGAEASIWDDLREDILPRDTDPLAAASVQQRQSACAVRDVYPGEKGPKSGPFYVPDPGGTVCLTPAFQRP